MFGNMIHIKVNRDEQVIYGYNDKKTGNNSAYCFLYSLGIVKMIELPLP